MTAAGVVTALLALLDFAVKVVALGLLPQNRRPSSATAWLLLVFFLPFVGILAFLLIGSRSVDRGRRQIHREVNAFVSERVEAAGPTTTRATQDVEPAWLRSATYLNQHLATLPATEGNDARLMSVYEDSIAAMTTAVHEAERFVSVEFYIMAWDHLTAPFFEALTEALHRGVEVRVLFDHLASRGIPGYKDMLRRFDEAGFDWHPMLPLQPLKGRWRRPDLRNHRKILVVDGRVAITGSQNLVEPSYDKPKLQQAGRQWRELTVRLTGPVVTSLNVVFATDWYVETHEVLDPTHFAPPPGGHPPGRINCQVVPSGPGFPNENNLRLFNTLIYGAQCRLSLTSPYFVPDESLLYAVTTAAQRGVAVELFVSEKADQMMVGHAQMSYYQALLEAGVRIYLYPEPFVLHSKHFSVDDDVVIIGSSNMDMRSFGLNFEVSVMAFGGDVVRDVRAVEDGYRTLSRELTREEWSRRPLRSRYVDNVMRLTSALQ
jgi:cardiolipin synthase